MLVHRSDCGRRDTCPTDTSERKSLPCIAAIGMGMGCKQGPAQRRQCPCIAAIAMSVDPGPAALVRSILEIAATWSRTFSCRRNRSAPPGLCAIWHSLALHAASFPTKEHADTGKTTILSHGQPLNEFNITETEAGKPGKRQSCRMGDGLAGIWCVFVSLAQRRCGNPAE